MPRWTGVDGKLGSPFSFCPMPVGTRGRLEFDGVVGCRISLSLFGCDGALVGAVVPFFVTPTRASRLPRLGYDSFKTSLSSSSGEARSFCVVLDISVLDGGDSLVSPGVRDLRCGVPRTLMLFAPDAVAFFVLSRDIPRSDSRHLPALVSSLTS